MTTRPLQDFFIRLIFLPGEVAQIRNMQLAAREFTDHYPRHGDWLEVAIEEVMSGARVAYGVFKSGISRDQVPSLALVGSIIIKPQNYAGVAELKNLFIMPEYRGKRYGDTLYRDVENYCRKAGFRHRS